MISNQSKTSIVSEVLLVFTASIVVIWQVNSIDGFKAWQNQNLGLSVISILLGTFLVPMAAIAVTDLKGQRQVRLFKPVNLYAALRRAGKAMIVMLPVTILSFPMVQFMGYTFKSWTGALIIAGWHLAAIPLLMLLFRKKPVAEEKSFTFKDCSWIILIPVLSAILIWAVHSTNPKAAGVITMLVFVGLAEEFKYRAYIQHRLNVAFGKPFEILGFQFGWGLILASLIFGLGHVIEPGEPLHWAWGMWTTISGLCFGIIREKGGGFLSSAMVHGFIMTFPVLFS